VAETVIRSGTQFLGHALRPSEAQAPFLGKFRLRRTMQFACGWSIKISSLASGIKKEERYGPPRKEHAEQGNGARITFPKRVTPPDLDSYAG